MQFFATDNRGHRGKEKNILKNPAPFFIPRGNLNYKMVGFECSFLQLTAEVTGGKKKIFLKIQPPSSSPGVTESTK